MITVWNTTLSSSTNKSIRLNIQSTNYDIYWKNIDDVTINGNITGLNAPYTLTLPSTGIYKISIYSSAPNFYFRSGDKITQSKNLIEVAQWGDLNYSSFFKSFEG